MSAYTPAQVAALTLMLDNERTGFPVTLTDAGRQAVNG